MNGFIDQVLMWLSDNAYYLGLWSGIAIALAILFPLLNMLLTHLTYKYEISTYGNVPNPPSFTEEQKMLLKKALFWWGRQCDRWYTTTDKKVDELLNGRDINLVDFERIGDATQVGKLYGVNKPSEEVQSVFDELQKAMIPVEMRLRDEVKYKKTNQSLIKEADVLGRQLNIARYSAIAAIASTIATMFLTYIAYLDSISKCN
jgi:hypothetical protein